MLALLSLTTQEREMSRMLTSEEAATALGVSSVSIFRYVEQGELRAARVGKRRMIRIAPADLKKFADQNGIMCNLPEGFEDDDVEQAG